MGTGSGSRFTFGVAEALARAFTIKGEFGRRAAINTGSGDDRIEAADGRVDRVRCGPGADSVTADRIDVLSGCENITRPMG